MRHAASMRGHHDTSGASDGHQATWPITKKPGISIKLNYEWYRPSHPKYDSKTQAGIYGIYTYIWKQKKLGKSW